MIKDITIGEFRTRPIYTRLFLAAKVYVVYNNPEDISQCFIFYLSFLKNEIEVISLGINEVEDFLPVKDTVIRMFSSMFGTTNKMKYFIDPRVIVQANVAFGKKLFSNTSDNIPRRYNIICACLMILSNPIEKLSTKYEMIKELPSQNLLIDNLSILIVNYLVRNETLFAQDDEEIVEEENKEEVKDKDYKEEADEEVDNNNFDLLHFSSGDRGKKIICLLITPNKLFKLRII